MNMFNIQNDFWDVCKPPTVLLPRHGRAKSRPLMPEPDQDSSSPFTCVSGAPILSPESLGVAAQGFGRYCPSSTSTVSVLLPPGRVCKVLGFLCVKDWELSA